MSQGVEELMNYQEIIFNELKQLCNNYKKDSPDRKNAGYLDDRLSRLNLIWEKFVFNHGKLEETGISNIQYFKDDVFSSTKKMYEGVLKDILKRKSEIPSIPPTPSTSHEQLSPTASLKEGKSRFNFDDIKFHIPPRASNETSEKQQDLLRQQYCNIKAFERKVEKINSESSIEKWKLEENLNILKSKWQVIEKTNWELDYISQEEDSTYKQKYEAAEDIYDKLRDKLQNKIWNNAHYEKATPIIVIPDFYGNYNQWLTFKDLYMESVHNNPSLSNAQKMQHLKTKLKGEAEKLIQHLGISSDNYLSSWDIITHRYDNKRLLFTSYMNTLLNQQTIQQANAANVRKLHDIMQECLNGLGNIGLDITSWGPMIVHLLTQKLDSDSYNEYIKDLKEPREFPDLKEFENFLESKFMALEALQGNSQQKQYSNRNVTSSKPTNLMPVHNNNYKWNNKSRSSHFNKPQITSKTYFTTTRNCPICKTDHVLMQCDKFLKMSAKARYDTVKNLRVCRNCLYSHGEKQCISKKKCKICYKSHHTLMHDPEFGQRAPSAANLPSTSTQSPAVNNIINEDKEVLLTTVLLKVKTIDGNYINMRGLLDQGSQVSLITEDAAQRLRLPRRKLSAVVSGIGSLSGNCKGSINLECNSIHADFNFNLETLIIKKLINNLPTTTFSTENWVHLQGLKLADPNFNISGPIDLLLGADIYSELILNGVIKSEHFPVAQQTKLGWILCGNVKTFNCLVTLIDLEDMSRFWETEDITDIRTLTNEEQHCEEFYNSTTTRLDNGKYVVQMPMKQDDINNLGATKPQAQAQFLQLERKMNNNNDLSTEYKHFMKDYIIRGHMKPVSSKTRNKGQVYLPHHGVLRAESTTTKLRVVFNASYKTKTQKSLNDLMYSGPNLQKDILSLLLNWRTYKYVLTADIEKMYRNILLHEDQQNLQTIIWRSNRKEPLQEWQLCTVTYGMKSAPFLAMRTLYQLAADEKENYPEAAQVLQNYFYMDDLVYGQDDIESAKNMVLKLNALLKKGGFNLRKWATNEPIILDNLEEDQKSSQSKINFNPEQTSTMQQTNKTLGISWNPETDAFTYLWNLPERKNMTKRLLLAEISKLYDPLGLLSPATIKAKLIFQKLWMSRIEWDENVPAELNNEWELLRKNLYLLNNLSIPRWLQSTDKIIEIHGFSDASEKAYACVIYSRVKMNNDNYAITIITAKTKVAPVSKKMSLPRMELCGALLLAKLIEKLKKSLNDKNLQVYCWCDSKVVIAWLQGDINRWERFVANRVAQIIVYLCIIPATQWNYVKSEENPADCATRGLSPTQLLTHNLWWEGPKWLKAYETITKSEITKFEMTDLVDDEPKQLECCVALYKRNEIIASLLNKYSCFKRVIRVLSWILRAIRVIKAMNSNCNLTNFNKKRLEKSLSPQEINEATELIIKEVQMEYFSQEIKLLQNNQPVQARSNLLKLTPFLDANGLLRVKGRLVNSTLPAESKHPLILPATGRLTELVIQAAHHETLHGGARLTLGYLRLKYWIIGGNRTVKKELRQCVKCHRFKPHRNHQIMGDLPKERVTPARPFTNTGVDFTGHVDVKINKGRGVKTCKAYIAIFICMVTKAVHLELVSDLTTQTFLAAFKRMCARRGTPKNMFSDNGTNFVGAAKILQDEFTRHKTFMTSDFLDEMTHLKIKWHFNAPLWPTAGGLWEAAVKSMKYHLKRVLGEQKLTFEQFTTLLTQIEACLNSRPLCPLSEDVDDLEYLTPGHFLIGEPLLSPLQAEEDFNQYDLRNRWKLVDQMNLHIWKRWASEYLHQLQTRSKWQQSKENLEKGDLVLLKEDNLPPGRWALGRIIELHPGADGKVRVVTLKTKKGQLKRPITRLSSLPLKNNIQTLANKTTENTTDCTAQQEKPAIQKRTRTKKHNLLSLLLLTMLVTLGIHTTQAAPIVQNYHVTQFQNNHPIYFDEAGKLQLIHDVWTVLIYYNLTSFFQATKNLNTYIDRVDEICKHVAHEYSACESVISQLRHELDNLVENNHILLSSHSRQKRGYFDGVGKLARTLFGVLDEDFALKYENDIKNLQNNDDYLLKLMKNQTLIIEAENSIIKRNTEFMCKQYAILHNYINKTSSVMTKIENRAQMLFAISEIHSAGMTSTLILSHLHRIQEMLMNALTNIYRGHLDTHLFPASQLIQQLNIISGQLPQGLSLPIKDIQQEFLDIYELIYVKARLTNNYLLFELHIPLLSDEDYNLYRVIPIPYLRDGQWKLVQPQSNFMAINFIKNSYIMMEEKDIQQCTSYGIDKFTCISRQPVYSLNDKKAPCEAKVFSQQTSLSCVSKDVTCTETWIKLHKPNVWLFTLCTKQLMRIICKDQVTPAVIDGTGIITLKPKCILQKKDATIFTHNHLGNNFYMTPDIEVPMLNSSINNMFDLGWKNAEVNITNLNGPSITDFSKIEQQLTYQKEKEQLTKWAPISNHDIYHYSVTSLLLGGIAVSALCYCLRRKCCKTTTAKEGDLPQATRGVANGAADNIEEIEMRDMQNRNKKTEPIYSEVKRETRFQFDKISNLG